MKKHILFIVIFTCILLRLDSKAQSLSPRAIPTAGGYFKGGGNSLSWTIGETFTQTFQSGNMLLTQGEQQPYILIRILNLKAFIEGYYLTGTGQMTPVLFNSGLSTDPSVCDSIIVEFHDQFNPAVILATDNIVLKIDGTAFAHFPLALSGTAAYISIRGRNIIETWSKLPVNLGNNTTFDFTAP